MPRSQNPVVIVHGWSDNSDSFKPLAAFLRSNEIEVVSVFLADYLSREDDITVDDAAKAMEVAVRAQLAAGQLKQPFDLLMHSTGSLVCRAWLSSYYSHVASADLPVQRMVMLAPANFGSVLAATGKTIIGKVVKGADNGFHTGTQMLNGLELGSPFQWDLSMRDLFNVEPGAAVTIYGKDRVWPFVISGSMPYQAGLVQIVNEHGSDGTVRVAAANLNAYGATLDFTVTPSVAMDMADGQNAAAIAQGALVPWRYRYDEEMVFPLAVVNHRDHGSITDPASRGHGESEAEQMQFQQFLLSALRCESFDAYQAIEKAWSEHSDQVQDPAQADEDHHMHMQLNVFVVDEYQKPVPDYMVEFLSPVFTDSEEMTVVFHTKVIRHIHKNKQNEALRTFFIDRQRLFELFYDKMPAGKAKELRMSVSAAPPGKNVSYFNEGQGGNGQFIIHSQDDASRWLHRNATHFLKIVIPRQPSAAVFTLKSAP